MEEEKRRVLEVLEKYSFSKFNEEQVEEIVKLVNEKEIIKLYDDMFITYAEGTNMILHIISEYANNFPNKGAFPKPPKSNTQ